MIEVKICQGTACFVFGAAELLAAADELPEAWKKQCEIIPVPCLGRCNERHDGEHMPYVSIGGVLHHGVTGEELTHLIAKALGE